MPTINKNHKTVKRLEIGYTSDAYDVFTENYRDVFGSVPAHMKVKCCSCGTTSSIKTSSFGPSDFIMLCMKCNSLPTLISSIRSPQNYFKMSFV